MLLSMESPSTDSISARVSDSGPFILSVASPTGLTGWSSHGRIMSNVILKVKCENNVQQGVKRLRNTRPRLHDEVRNNLMEEWTESMMISG